MAENQDDSEKTEEPTQRRLDEARKKGDVPKSQEVTAFIMLAAGAMLVIGMGGPTATHMRAELGVYLAAPHAFSLDAHGVQAALLGALLSVVGPLGIFFAALVAAGVCGHLVQTGWLVTTEKIQPKLDKLSPLAGAKRVFGPQAGANFLRGIAKMVIVGVAGALAVWSRRNELPSMSARGVESLMPAARDALIVFVLAALAVYALLAIADLVMVRVSYTQRQRMSRQDVKDENKQTDGDPHVKARLRQIRQERSKRRMDGGRAGGDRGDHQPDPLCGRAAL